MGRDLTSNISLSLSPCQRGCFISPCCHTLRRRSSTVRILCLRREKWDHDPPTVSTWNLIGEGRTLYNYACVSVLGWEMSSKPNRQQENREHPNASAAGKCTPRSQGVPEDQESRTEPPSSTFDSGTPIICIPERLVRIVNNRLELM